MARLRTNAYLHGPVSLLHEQRQLGAACLVLDAESTTKRSFRRVLNDVGALVDERLPDRGATRRDLRDVGHAVSLPILHGETPRNGRVRADNPFLRATSRGHVRARRCFADAACSRKMSIACRRL